MTTNNLTEQWKNGELKSGTYYINVQDYDSSEVFEDIDCYFGEVVDDWGHYDNDQIQEVLAEVPDYIEWKEMKEQRDACAWALDKIGDILVKHKLVKKKDEVLK